MAYKINEIEGVGEVYCAKLEAAGIATTEDLLAKCAKPAGRKAVAEETGIPEKNILRFCNHADLMRISGVGPQFAELLEAAGVDTVKELKHRVAANLAAKMAEVNDVKHLCHKNPSEKEIQKMVDQAKELEPVLEY